MPAKESQEEYELVALSPVRRLEKRIDELESTKGVDVGEFLKEIVDIVKMNQQLVNEMAKANDSLRIELSKIPGRLEALTNNLNELLSYIKVSATEETTGGGESYKPLVERLDQLIETNKKILEGNQNMLTTLDEIDRKLKKPSLPFLPMRKPILAQRPL